MDHPQISVLKMSDDEAGERFIVKLTDPARLRLKTGRSTTTTNHLTEVQVRLALGQRGQTTLFADRCLRQARAAYDPRQN